MNLNKIPHPTYLPVLKKIAEIIIYIVAIPLLLVAGVLFLILEAILFTSSVTLYPITLGWSIELAYLGKHLWTKADKILSETSEP